MSRPGLLKEVAPAGRVWGFCPIRTLLRWASLGEAETTALSLGLKLTTSPVHDDLEIEHTTTPLATT